MKKNKKIRLKSLWSLLPLTIVTLVVMIVFQNCGKIEVRTPEKILASNAKAGTGYLCLPDGYSLESFFITNLNIKPSLNGVLPDSDGDGLSDAEEEKLGLNPLSRRSAGKVLDPVCTDVDYGVSCANFNLNCATGQNETGINECDVLALNLNQVAGPGVGIDSDRDGIPDFLEVRISSFPNLDDSYNDLDFDLVNNMVEAERGTSSRNFSSSFPASNFVRVVKTKLQSNDCSGEYWKIDIPHLPVVPVAEFNDAFRDRGDFSHGKDQNVIVTFLKIKPNGDPVANRKTFFSRQLVTYDPTDADRSLIFSQDSLLFLGEVEP